MRKRFLLCLAAGMAYSSSVMPAHAAEINPPPAATCVDGNFFDGLDTRYAASYCATAVSHALYTAQSYSNSDATLAAAEVGDNAVFGHSGHALVTCSDLAGTNCTAGASLFAPTSSSALEITSLLGDPKFGAIQGPTQLCTDGVIKSVDAISGSCRSYTLVQYPFEQFMSRFNLALFQSCDSAHDGVNGYDSLVTSANTVKVGTAIGFNKVIYQVGAPGSNLGGDAFSRRFWGDLDNGVTYATAVVNAANAAGGTTYKFAYYTIRHQANAQTKLRPANFNTPGA